MSSIATFYILPESKRVDFTEAHRNEKTVTLQRGFFGTKTVVTGERFLWEYLDSTSKDRTDLPFPGFAFIDYFFAFVAPSLPKDLEAALRAAALNEHYYLFSSDVAARLAAYLSSHPPDSATLSEFAAEQNPAGGAPYVQTLFLTHDFVAAWFGRTAAGTFGVLHITF